MQTYAEIGKELNISHQAVYEIERRALSKLKVLLKEFRDHVPVDSYDPYGG